MAPEKFDTSAIDYLQRAGHAPPPIDVGAPATQAPPSARRMLRIRGVGQRDKDALPRPGEPFHLSSEDLLVALYSYKIATALEITSTPGGQRLGIGTWLPVASSTDRALDANTGILRSALASMYPVVDTGPMPEPEAAWSHSGLVMGVPSIKTPDSVDGTLPIDRLLRAMAGSPSWSVLALAQPVGEQITHGLRLQLLNEMRAVSGAAAGVGQRPPSQHYLELLKVALDNLTQGQGGGLWRAAIYLLGDQTSYFRLASVWRGIFSGPGSAPEPVRVFDERAVVDLARAWALPNPVGTAAEPPGHVRYPFAHQTLLTSRQLAAYIHLPRVETRGFAVTLVPDFDVEPAPVTRERLALGTVVERNQPSNAQMAIARDQFTSHAFVTGVTGAGKTTTIMRILAELDAAGIPFLVVEPAKTEYRTLVHHPALGARVRVFTPGNETVAPLRLNPFEFPDGIPVGVHLDLLRSAFYASFGMWTPLPQVLELCLHEIYGDRGWNITADTNHRLRPGDSRIPAFPTLTDLIGKVDDVVGRLGYDQRVAADVRAALKTRLGSLRSGGKGRLLDVQRSTPFTALLDAPVILELEGLGDDDDKAFVMGLLMIRLAEERRAGGGSATLRHIVVFEEAHRLLSNPGARRGEADADVRGKAVETFTNLLSEVRAYGEGVIVVDQVPTKLAPDVIKNTSLKIAHRIVAGDDRATLAAAMAMNERQQRALAMLPRGRAAVFVDGEDVPILVDVQRLGPAAPDEPVSDAQVRERSATFAHGDGSNGDDWDGDGCGQARDACEAARRTLENPDVQLTLARLVLSTTFDPDALDRRRRELAVTANPTRPGAVDADAFLKALASHGGRWVAARRGAQYGWTYAETARVGDALAALMTAPGCGPDVVSRWDALAAALAPLDGGFGPFAACPRIWDGDGAPCRCRFAVADAVASGAYDTAWGRAQEADSQGATSQATWALCKRVAYDVIEFPDEACPADARPAVDTRATRVSLCAGQQLLARDRSIHPRSQVLSIERLIREATP